MCLPSSPLSQRHINAIFKSVDYEAVLEQMILLIMELNHENKFSFQVDKCSVHKCFMKSKFMSLTKIQVSKWPTNECQL